MTRPIRPDLQDFDEVKRDYCRQHHIDIAKLNARLETDDRLAAELYQLAQAAKFNRKAAGAERSSLQGVLPGP